MITGVPLGTLHWNQTPSKKNATTSTARWLWSSRPCFLPDDNPQAVGGTRCGRATRWPHPARFVRKWACLRDAARGVCHRSPQTGLGPTEVNIWPLSPVPGIQFQTTWADRWEPLSSVTSPLDHTCEGGEAGRWVWLVTGKTDPWIKVLDPAAPPPGRGLEPEFCPWAREVILCVRGMTPHIPYKPRTAGCRELRGRCTGHCPGRGPETAGKLCPAPSRTPRVSSVSLSQAVSSQWDCNEK